MSSVGLAVALLARAVDAGTQAQAACSTADDHARTMLDIYTQIADDSGQDAPNAAGRNVSDAQDTLLQITNSLHHAAEALGDYVRTIAPGLTGNIKPASERRPTGAELLEMPGAKTSLRARVVRRGVQRFDDVSDTAKGAAEVGSSVKEYLNLPKDPGPSHALTRQPPQDVPTARPTDTGVSTGNVVDAAMTGAALMVGWRHFWRRMGQMFRARPDDGNP